MYLHHFLATQIFMAVLVHGEQLRPVPGEEKCVEKSLVYLTLPALDLRKEFSKPATLDDCRNQCIEQVKKDFTKPPNSKLFWCLSDPPSVPISVLLIEKMNSGKCTCQYTFHFQQLTSSCGIRGLFNRFNSVAQQLPGALTRQKPVYTPLNGGKVECGKITYVEGPVLNIDKHN
ncbi:hypothetical protein BCR37DRAFT_217942 [Protomyces lactucae-debilis]|uniref:Apple domain-containing protein n=1 Tax=Protomyces lactucae-debilis TaxID=2754530 RepID=A0A1Y2FQP5_PROLT|nr:uncharacterized protein BCR37DRAFT_217942 [Protomyces lactucae-debilis]ORY86321.1 hypothetical protein BCR37DRAFT_217942 [Protomyces lactucae-debilis]